MNNRQRKKRILSYLLSAALIFTTIPMQLLTVCAQGIDNVVTALTENTTEFLGGNGTEESPYLISNKTHLNNVRKYLNAHFKMVADIEFTEDDFAENGAFYNDGQGWEPIGSSSTSAFTGVFDGDEHTIKGLYINISSSTSVVYAGLFGYNKGTIRNLGILDSDISASSSSSYGSDYAYAGGIVGRNDGTISGCYNTGSVSASSSSSSYSDYAYAYAYAGGIVGRNDGTISGCYNTGSVSASASDYAYAGGIVGRNDGTISDCYNTGSVSASDYAGGIAGDNYQGTISGCYNTGNVSFTFSYAGGIAGRNDGTISGCYNTGSVSASAFYGAGGIAGRNDGTISECYNTGSVSGSDYDAGGIAGYNYYGTISECYNTGSVSAASDYANAGGIAGDNYYGTISGCYNTGSVFSYDCAGGIAGDNYQGTISECYYLDTISKGAGDGADTAVQCTVEEMKEQGTFVGFDFESIWEMSAGNSYPLPTLQKLPYTDEKEENTIEFLGGTGTPYNPYLISTKEHLNNVRKHLDAHFKMVADIEFADADFAEGGKFYNGGQGWEPIVSNSTSAFTGVFDGNGHTIKGLYIDIPSSASDVYAGSVYAGLFGYNKGTIRNLGILDSDVSSSSYAYIGGIAGRNDGTISECYNTGSVSGSDYDAGGIAGYNYYGTISECYNTGSVFSYDCAGGIAGYNYYGTISECYNTGSVSASDSSYAYAGGIAGYIYYGTISGCYNTGSVSASDSSYAYAGGIAGYIYYGTISGCYNTGSVSASFSGSDADYAGGIAGGNTGTISECYNTGSVFSYDYAGGIAGYNNYNGTISNSYYLDSMFKGVGYGEDTAVQCTEEEMKQQSTFVGFDFDTIWEIDNYHTYPYPQLKNNRQESIKSIEILSNPTNNQTLEGILPDLTGAKVKITYQDGKTVTVDATTKMLSELNINQAGSQTVHLTYGGVKSTETITIEVLKKQLDHIKVNALPNKTTYVQGQPLDLTGGSITLFYNNGSNDDIAMNLAEIDYDIEKTGTVTVTVSYQGKTDTFDITVLEKQIKSITLTEPNKLSYLEGQELDLTGGSLKVFYESEDNYSETIPLELSMISGYDKNKVAIQTLTVSYGGQTTTFVVNVVAKSLGTIEVSTLPTKTEYLEGKETLDVTGGKLTLIYNNGTSEVIDLTAGMVTGFDNTQVGPQTLTVTYKGKKTTFEVEIVAKSLTEIKVTKKPDKLSYLEGDAFNPAGMEVTAYYNNGTSEKITNYEVSGYTSTPGDKVITIRYEDKTVTFKVTVTAKSLTGIQITKQPNKTTYIEGTVFDSTGMELTLTYNNGTSETITSGWQEEYDFSSSGQKTVSITYGGKKTSLTVTVTAKQVTGIAIATPPNKTSYLEGEEIDTTGLTLRVTYNNGSEEIISGNWTIAGYDSTPGKKNVTVTYGGKNATFTVTVETTHFAGGYGTEESPYHIKTWQHLNNIRDYSTSWFLLDNDLVSDGTLWIPIPKFEGNFDGQNHSIYNLKIDIHDNKTSTAGLIGWNAGTVIDVSIENTNIVITNALNSPYAGGLAGTNSGTISGCSYNGEIDSSSNQKMSYAGGITGYNSGKIENCANVGKINSSFWTGGIAGMNRGTILTCYNTGAIRSSTSLGSIGVSAGGISGENNSQIKNCFNIGTVSARSSYGESAFAGGIVGTQIGGATISCYNAGVLTKLYGDYIGAIAGHYSGGNFENCYYHENMSSSYGVGAACGQKLKQEQMIKQQSFVGFDFDTVWTMAGNTDYLYPELKNVPMHFDKKLESIEVTTLPTKLEYLEGKDTLDVTGGKLKLTYNNGTSEVIDLTPNMVSGFDNTQVGPQTLTVTYKGKITTFEVEIIAKSLESIEVSTLPSKLEYLEGKDTLDVTGGKLTLTYNNGTTEVINLTPDMVTGFDNTQIGPQTLTVTYKGKITTFEVEIIAKSLESIEVTTLPTKTEYLEGKETLDVTGGKLKLTYNNSTSEVIDLTSDMITGFDNTKVGKQTLTVTYKGKITTFEVEIVAKSLESIEVSTLPTKTEYLEGKDTLDVTGGKLTLTYNNGTSEIINLTPDMVTGFDNTQVGTQTLTVTYKGKTTTFKVEIVAKSLESIEVTTLPTKTEYLEGKETLDVTGGKLTLIYNNGASEVIDLTADMITGFNNTKVGPQTLTVTYKGKTTSFEVEIVAKSLESIEVTTLPTKTEYLERKDKLDVTGGKLKLTYNNGTTEVIDLTAGMVTGFNNTKVGPQTLTVTYKGKTTSFEVEIVAKSLTGIQITKQPNKLSYIEGTAFDSTGMELTLTYNNGTSETITSGWQEEYDFSSPGQKTVSITYGGKKTTLTVTVTAKQVTSIAIASKPNKTTYIEGQELDTTGLKLKVSYNNGTSEVVTSNWKISGYDKNRVGKQTVTVTYQGKTATFTVTVNSRVPSSITSNVYTVSGGWISKIPAGTTISTLVNGINEKQYIKVFKGNSEVSGNTVVGTGMVVKLMDGNTVKQSVTVVVTGDTNGDGGITITDMIAVKAHVLKKSTLSGAAAKAADTNGDNGISITDFIQIKADILGKSKIQAR